MLLKTLRIITIYRFNITMLLLASNIFNVFSPLDQFEIRELISLDLGLLNHFHLSSTNIGLYLIIGCLIVLALNILATNLGKVVSNN